MQRSPLPRFNGSTPLTLACAADRGRAKTMQGSVASNDNSAAFRRFVPSPHFRLSQQSGHGRTHRGYRAGSFDGACTAIFHSPLGWRRQTFTILPRSSTFVPSFREIIIV